MPVEGKTARGRVYKRMTLAEQFWPKVNKNGPIVPYVGTRCWIWTGAKKSSGYGELGNHQGHMTAHKASVILHGGRLPADGEEFCHKCDVRACVNPSHLFIGTRSDNMSDASAKGRLRQQARPWTIARGDRHGSRTHPECLQRGESHYNTSLTEADVRHIRKLREQGHTLERIAEIYSITPSSVWVICKRRNWKHVK